MTGQGIEKAFLALVHGNGREQACSSAHISHKNFQEFTLELVGLIWFVTDTLAGARRQRLKKQRENRRNIDSRPFLIDDACAIHPMRPLACRRVNVLGAPCTACW